MCTIFRYRIQVNEGKKKRCLLSEVEDYLTVEYKVLQSEEYLLFLIQEHREIFLHVISTDMTELKFAYVQKNLKVSNELSKSNHGRVFLLINRF